MALVTTESSARDVGASGRLAASTDNDSESLLGPTLLTA